MRNRKRIGYGSLDWDGGRNSKIWLRNAFLATIEKLEPKKEKKPLGDLAKKPLEQYVRFVESITRRRKVTQKLKKAQEGEEVSLFGLDQDDPLRDSIREWGKTYHLNSPWCYDVALRTLQDWHEFKETTVKRFASLPFYGHPDYLGFGSLVGVYELTKMPRGSLNEEQRPL